MKIEEYEAAAEAILFAMGDSVEIKKLAFALQVNEREAEMILRNLADRYQADNCGLQILELDGAYRFGTKPSQYEYLILDCKTAEKAGTDRCIAGNLSIVAYKQPVTRVEIEKIRGVSCEHAINKLLEYGLIQEAGRLDAPGRPILFGTTEEFLRCFDVQSVEELPDMNPEKVEELKQEAEEEVQLQLKL